MWEMLGGSLTFVTWMATWDFSKFLSIQVTKRGLLLLALVVHLHTGGYPMGYMMPLSPSSNA